MSLKRKRRIIVYSLVTRYGPCTSCQRKELIKSIRVFLSFGKIEYWISDNLPEYIYCIIFQNNQTIWQNKFPENL